MQGRRRILFIAENVTLAQVVRLRTLAAGLDPLRYEVHFACSAFDELLFQGTTFRRWVVGSIDKARAMRMVARGERLYDQSTLDRYVEEELALIATVQPDLIVGDLRMSLAVSAPLSRVPCATLINAYWSPHAERDAFPMPDHPIVTLLGAELAGRYFPRAMPRVFAHHAAPLNAVRRKRGLPELSGLLEQLTWGDLTLYPDIPELCPTRQLPQQHRYLGPVLWSPPVPLPDEFTQFVESGPLVYVTLGSSGDLGVLPVVLEALEGLPLRAVVATAQRVSLQDVPRNVHVSDYLPGDLVAAQAAVVITNGGSSTGYQALAQGTPVLGLPSNLDQYLAMTAIERSGAGLLVRAGAAKPQQVRQALLQLLESEHYRARARQLASSLASYDCHVEFDRAISSHFKVGHRSESGTSSSATRPVLPQES